MSTPTHLIRNFSIIAHIDHGKSTLADRMLDATGALTDRERKAQFLDNMDLERERGITIKAQTVRLTYNADDGQTYELNLIDTPGHVDFHYEVSRSLAACEGALLVVDASQGVEAQTLANVYLALDHNLRSCRSSTRSICRRPIPRTRGAQIEEVVGLDASEAILASAKEGIGIHEILEAIVARSRRPWAIPGSRCSALIFDSWYDTYRGVVILVRVIDGVMRPKQKMLLHGGRGASTRCRPWARSRRSRASSTSSAPGEVGFVTAAIKEVADAKVGDTITEARAPLRRAAARLQGGQADGVRRHLPDRLGALRGPARRARQAAPQRRVVHLRARDARRRSASASAAASSACCTWRSSRSGSSASTTSTSSPPRRPCASAVVRRDGSVIELDNPAKFPPTASIEHDRGADHRRHDPHAAGVRRRACSSSARSGAARRPGSTTPARSASSSATSCRSPRWSSASTTG